MEVMAPEATTPRHWLSVDDAPASEILELIDLAETHRKDSARFAGALGGKHAAMLFEKPSLRTRVSFEVGFSKLGAHGVYMDHGSERLGAREAVKDYALNLERWVDVIVARVFEHKTLEEMAAVASVPVVNALSDIEHPCQALADFQTIRQKLGTLEGVKVVWLGDGNNVCHSLMLGAASLGVSMTVITPKGFEPKFDIVRRALKASQHTAATIELTSDLAAVQGHHAVYTDKWISMGQGHQTGLRNEAFEDFRVTAELMESANKGIPGETLFMHCLPAKRGEEVTDEVIDAPSSVVYDQAENRMHAQNALLLRLFGVA